MKARSRFWWIAAAGLLTACATVPTGPSVMVLPGSGKNFEQFQNDDAICRQWAAQQTGGPVKPERTAVTGAAVGTVVGAAAGAAIGAAAGSPATGAAVGAGVGVLGGTAAGASAAHETGTSVQRRYDMTYMQCMYAKGNQIPVSGYRQSTYTAPASAPATSGSPPTAAPAPPPSAPPQPPAGSPPAPPPGPR